MFATVRAVLGAFVNAWFTERPARHAAALAYYSMFAFAPMVYLALKVAGLFVNELLAAGQLYSRIAELFGNQTADLVRNLVIDASQRTTEGGMLTILVSAGALLWAATGFFTNLKYSLNAIWHVSGDGRSAVGGMILDRLLSFAFIIGLGVILAVAVVASVAAPVLSDWLQRQLPWQVDNGPVLFGLTLLTLAMVYKILPDTHVRWRYAWSGALVGALGLTVAVVILVSYLGMSRFDSAFEAAGSLAVFLIGIYYLVQIVLAGALFTRILAKRHERAGTT